MSENFLQTFLLKESGVRGAVVVLTTELSELLSRASVSHASQTLLGEALLANVLMTSHLKIDGLVSIQAKGEGPIKLLATECNNDLHFRGLVESDLSSQDVPRVFDGMTLTITLEPKKGSRYQGIVPLSEATLATCLEHYFIQSEQLSTSFMFSVTEGRAVGLMLQVLPGDESSIDDWQRVSMLKDTLKQDEMQGLTVETWLYRLFHEEGVEVYEKRFVAFKCSCSRERFERALVTLGQAELQEVLQERGKIETECHFCKAVYLFDQKAIDELFSSGSSTVDH